jgi:hypothetical protein
VNLIQPERFARTGKPLAHPRTIRCHRLWIVADVLAQI